MKNYAYEKISKIGLFIWCLGTIFYVYEMIVKSSISSLSLVLQGQYSLTATELSLISSMFYWCYVVMQIPAGIIIDRIGVRRSLVIASLCCGVGTILFALSDSFSTFLLTRAVMGFGGAFGFVCGLKLAANWLPPRFFPLFAGLVQFMGYMGGAFTGAPLSSIVANNNWVYVFLTIGVIGVCISVLTFICIRGKAPYANDESEHPTFSDVIGQLFRLIKKPQILVNAIFCLCVGGVSFALTDLWGKMYLIVVYGLPEDSAALAANTMVFIGIAITSPFWGALASVMQSSKRLLIFGSLMGIISTTAMLYLSVPNMTLQLIILCLCGFIIGASQASHLLNFDLVKKIVSGKYVATAIALLNMFVIAGGAMTQVVSGYVIEKVQASDSYKTQSINQAWVAINNVLDEEELKDSNQLHLISKNNQMHQIKLVYKGEDFTLYVRQHNNTGNAEITLAHLSNEEMSKGSQLLKYLTTNLRYHVFDSLSLKPMKNRYEHMVVKGQSISKVSHKWLKPKLTKVDGQSYYKSLIFKSPSAEHYSYRLGLLILPILFVIAFLMALLTRDRKPKDIRF